jgi:putative molybdopterin biosynthesis protein
LEVIGMSEVPTLNEAAEVWNGKDFRYSEVIVNRLLTLKEVAEILNVKVFRAAELVRLGILPAVRLGRQIRVDREQLSGFIARGGKSLPKVGDRA